MSRNHSTTEMRCLVAVIVPATGCVLTCDSGYGCTVPSVLIGRRDRACEQIQRTFRDRWGLNIYLVDMLPNDGDDDHGLWIAEFLDTVVPHGFVAKDIEDLPEQEDSEVVARLRIWRNGAFKAKPIVKVGWIGEARQWIEEVTGDQLHPMTTIAQYNGGGGFCLLCWQAFSGRRYWLKAVAEPNHHEFAVTSFLCNLAPGVSPLLLAVRPEWNAWLMLEDEASDSGSHPFPTAAVRALVHVQGLSLMHVDGLLERGAFDQRFEHVEEDLKLLFDYLDESMKLQESTKAPRLTRRDLNSLHDTLLHVYRELGDRTPESLLHGDLTGGNLSGRGDQCRFLDWCESYIGFAPISLHHLVMLYTREGTPAADAQQMIELYGQLWESEFGIRMSSFALSCGPLLAAASTLYGRGDWLHSPKERERRRSYSRTLARYMAREANLLQERGELCHC